MKIDTVTDNDGKATTHIAKRNTHVGVVSIEPYEYASSVELVMYALFELDSDGSRILIPSAGA